MRFIAVGSTIALFLAAAPVAAHAQAELVGMTHVKTIKPARGFIDDPFAFDDPGGRLLYMNSDTGKLAELHVLDLEKGGAELARIDITNVTTAPTAVRFADDRFFVTSRTADGKRVTAVLVDASGKVQRTFGPASDILLGERDGAPVVTLYTVTETKARGKSPAAFHHTIDLMTLDGKRPFGKPRVVIADDKGAIAKLDFRMNQWLDGYTRIAGIKAGTWNPKENQRAPDYEALYDVIAGEFVKRADITNVIDHTLLMRDLAAHHNESAFIALSSDQSRLELVTPEGRHPIDLGRPFKHYAPTTLEYQASAGGVFFFTLTIDPVNADAVSRKKADPQYLDLYEYRVGDKQARRRGRILLSSKRKLSWRATPQHWVVVPRMVGFDRGGTELQIYRFDPGTR